MGADNGNCRMDEGVAASGNKKHIGQYRVCLVATSGDKIAVDFIQFEAGAIPTSPIPTTTAAVTRAADVATITSLTPWFNTTAGTWVVEAWPSSAAGYYNVLDANVGAEHGIYSTPANKAECLYTSVGILTSAGTWGAAFKRVAASYQLNKLAMSAFAEAVQAKTSGAVPTPACFISAVHLTVSVKWTAGIKRLQSLPWAVSDQLLQATLHMLDIYLRVTSRADCIADLAALGLVAVPPALSLPIGPAAPEGRPPAPDACRSPVSPSTTLARWWRCLPW